MGFSTVFKEGGEDSPFSARRVMAFLLGVDSMANGFYALSKGVSDWHVYLMVMGIPLLMATILLFCTTLNDVVALTANIRKN